MAQANWQRPARQPRPEIASDEGGMWAIMDREETRLRRSPFAVRDPAFSSYVNDIACRLAGEHCPDIRVHLVHTPLFNASMAPNGMMQIWSGLLLRMENEAQLAAVIGHELGHYLQRHMVERLRDIKARAGLAQFLSLFGWAGAVGQLAIMASALAYSRDHEREADAIGLALMRETGYDVSQASRVWGNLLLERAARIDVRDESLFFATHPPSDERRETLARLASTFPGGETRAAQWRDRTKPFLLPWLRDEIGRGQHEESIALFSRMLASPPVQVEVLYARGEVLRIRGKVGDHDAALADYMAAVAAGGEPPETHRGLGFIFRSRGQGADSKHGFQIYLERAPDAPDAPMIKSYLNEAGI